MWISLLFIVPILKTTHTISPLTVLLILFKLSTLHIIKSVWYHDISLWLHILLYFCSAWSDEGCRVELTNHTHTICQCDHLTNFAILMDVHATYLPPSHQMALQIITYIGCIISVVCLLLAIVTFQLFRSLKVSEGCGVLKLYFKVYILYFL
jgi:hypothetical protein